MLRAPFFVKDELTGLLSLTADPIPSPEELGAE